MDIDELIAAFREAIRTRRLARFIYAGKRRLFAPHAVYRSTRGVLNVTGVLVRDPADPWRGASPRNMYLAGVADFELTPHAFPPDPKFSSRTGKYRSGVLCAVDRPDGGAAALPFGGAGANVGAGRGTGVKFYHNPRCSKSREALALLKARGVEPEIVEYLKSPPTAGELKRILKLLGLKPRELMRRKEAAYAENGLDDPKLTDDALIAAMVAHPILIERPIALAGDRAALGRPAEKVLAVLD